MATYLQLANSLISKCGISGGSIASVSNQTGEAGRVVSWINEAYTQIQLAFPDWYWMRSNVSFSTTANQGAYPSPGRHYRPCQLEDGFISLLRHIDGRAQRVFLERMDYDTFRDIYLFGNLDCRTPGLRSFPLRRTTPSIWGWPRIRRITRLWASISKQPTTLVNSTDTPAMPSQFHNIIVYKAMMMYGMYEAAQEVVIEGTNLYNQMLRRLVRDQLPDAESAGALA